MVGYALAVVPNESSADCLANSLARSPVVSQKDTSDVVATGGGGGGGGLTGVVPADFFEHAAANKTAAASSEAKKRIDSFGEAFI